MTSETEIRERLGRATEHVGAGPELETVLAGGRRARSRRRVAQVAGGVAVLAVVGVAASSTLGGGTQGDRGLDRPASRPAAPAAPSDFVAGSDVDQTLQVVVADHLPSLGAADDVFVSDWDHNGPMPDSRVDSATDWQAVYSVEGNGFRLFMGYPKPGEAGGCGDCPTTAVEGGQLSTASSQLLDPADGLPWHFNTMFVADDGFTVVATEMVPGLSLEQARADRQLDEQTLAGLVTDDRLTFPAPQRPGS